MAAHTLSVPWGEMHLTPAETEETAVTIQDREQAASTLQDQLAPRPSLPPWGSERATFWSQIRPWEPWGSHFKILVPVYFLKKEALATLAEKNSAALAC